MEATEMTPAEYAKTISQKCIEGIIDMLNAHGLSGAEGWVREAWNVPERPVNRHDCDLKCVSLPPRVDELSPRITEMEN